MMITHKYQINNKMANLKVKRGLKKKHFQLEELYIELLNRLKQQAKYKIHIKYNSINRD